MTPEEFVELFRAEREALLEGYRATPSRTEAGRILESLALPPESREAVDRAIHVVVTDVLYSVLLALDGAGSLGGVQQPYHLEDGDGTVLTGELEGLAYDALQEED